MRISDWSRRVLFRSRRISDGLVRRRKEHRLIDRMLAKLPEEFADLAEVRAVRRMVESKALNVVQLIHEPPAWQTGARDFEFSRSEEHTSELQPLMRISYAVFCLKKKNTQITMKTTSTMNNMKRQLLKAR